VSVNFLKIRSKDFNPLKIMSKNIKTYFKKVDFLKSEKALSDEVRPKSDF
jgi:hypothetical protein